jgi:amino acid transporter
MAYVAAEVKHPRRNIVRALVLGTVAVTVLYLLANGAFLYTLGYHGMATSEVVAADAIGTVFPHLGGRLISVLVCISALGAVNGLIFTGARISYAVGAEHRPFRLLGVWHPRTGTPVWALLVQAAIAVILILVLGSFVNTLLYTAAAVYAFYLATSAAVFVLRRKEPQVERPYRVTGYPFTTIIFCAVCAWLIYSAVAYRPWIAASSGVLLALGLPVYWLCRQRTNG